MSAPLVFMDCETTGLSLGDDIWEFAAIRRDPDGTERSWHFYMEHDPDGCFRLPKSFRDDHAARFPKPCASSTGKPRLSPASGEGIWKPGEVAVYLAHEVFAGRPHIVGAVPNFDTERVALLLRAHGYEPGWHYHLIDVENLAVGYLNGVAARAEDESVMRGEGGLGLDRSLAAPPWDSDALAAALGVTITEAERHTAMGDARWAMRIYDAVMGETLR
jgi:hypothetical protein